MKIFTLAIFSLTLAVFTMAQAPPLPPGASLVADGFEGPRGLTFGPDGPSTLPKQALVVLNWSPLDALLFQRSAHTTVAQRHASPA